MPEFAALCTGLAWRKRRPWTTDEKKGGAIGNRPNKEDNDKELRRHGHFSRRDRLATKAISAARPPM